MEEQGGYISCQIYNTSFSTTWNSIRLRSNLLHNGRHTFLIIVYLEFTVDSYQIKYISCHLALDVLKHSINLLLME
ncbi:hypothetical protein GWI33_008763 [Rhynchophorus ferrugineus]|uniref:Uncharacterized protein n=1 Tax=Rhynchophorus ferrugineus TaxID=354439 RepID=A0A834IBJ1_RHYFE|nr:hypothetical protein GWI33_008763 [Rhynchophorus ferrugineus]